MLNYSLSGGAFIFITYPTKSPIVKPMWNGQGWGDSRVEVNSIVKQKWLEEINTDLWQHASDNLFTLLSGNITRETEALKKELHVFPNPAHSKLYISTSDDFTVQEVKVFNARGQLVLEKKIFRAPSSNNEIDLSELENGVYTAVVNMNGRIEVEKFSVQK